MAAEDKTYTGTDALENLKWINLVMSRSEHARQHYQSYLRRLARWYDLYRGIYSGNFQQFRNSVHIPFLFSVIQSDVAKKVQTSFGNWPIVTFAGYGPEDEPTARKNEILISAQMKDCDSFTKAVDFFLTADMYGTGIARYGWLTKKRKERWREQGDGGVEVQMEGIVTRFDGPDWAVIDPLDFWPQPGARRIKDAMWVIHRYWLDLDDIEEQADDGIFDKSCVAKLRASGPNKEVDESMAERFSVYRNFTEWSARRQEKYAKPVEITEMWGLVPSDMAPAGVRMRVISIGNRNILMRNRPNPYWHGEIPYIEYSPMPDPHYFHGMGKCEVGSKMQMTANRFANQKLDGMDLWSDPPWLVNRQSGFDTKNLFLRAGRVIGTDGPVDDSSIRQLTPDLRGLQNLFGEIGQLWQWIQQGTGIVEDTVQGLPSSGRQTAREYLGRQEQVLTRLMLEARLAEEGFIEPLANAFRQLNKQYLQTPHELKILGSQALIDPLTGFALPQEPVPIDLSDLNPDYRARAVGSTQMLGKSAKQQNLIGVTQVMNGNPALMQLVNWGNWLKYTMHTFDIENPESMLNTAMTMVNQNALAPPPAPGAGPGMGEGMPPLDPQMLGAMMGGQGSSPIAPPVGPGAGLGLQ